MSKNRCLTLLFFVAIRLSQTVRAKNATCAKNEFTCNNSECILKRWRCDAEADCEDSSDEQNCESFLPCSINEFQCKKSKECIYKDWRCDSDHDCGDMSDELNCHNRSCTQDEHRCTNGLCIQKSFLCDGVDDCGDSSDEQNCGIVVRCKEGEFRCDSKECVYGRWRCDGEEDCSNGKDEINCSGKTCLPGHWICQRGDCIPEEFRCDGDLDCDDKSDEMGCPTANVDRNCEIKGKFRCESGQCIHKHWRCDGDNDCRNGTDEKDCGPEPCSTNDSFLCTSGRCIKKHWQCDGQKDCFDGDDEKNCTYNSTSAVCPHKLQFRCTTGQCIDGKQSCDGRKDCNDGSDESRCPTLANQTSCGTNNGGCQHICEDDGSSLRCSCKPGYEVDMKDLVTCTDRDECKIVGFCSQKCVNAQGSFNCSCIEGYVLQPDGRKCKALGPQPSLIFSNQVDIRKLEAQSSDKINAYVVDDLRNAIAIDYLFEQELIFWTDITLHTIKQAFMNGTNIKDVVKFGLDIPSGLSVDWLGKKLFWADSGSGRIEVTNLDGSQRKVVFWEPLGKLRAIASYPSKGYLFWTEWDVGLNHTKSSITRANMDGTDFKRIVHRNVAWPNGLVIDYTADMIFWIDARLGVIESSDLDGRSRRMVMRNELLHPFAITVFEDSVYWTDSVSKAIFTANKFDGRDYTVVKQNLKSPVDITSFHPQRQPVGVRKCGDNNGNCSHLCLATSKDFKCACPTGYKLINATHCSQYIDEFLAYVGNFAIRRISLDTNDMLDVVLPFDSVMDVFAMDWDPVEDEVYWADDDEGQITIRKGRLHPFRQESVVYEFPGKVSGIGVDWLSRKLYWSDEERNYIRVSNLDGSFATVILWKVVGPKNLILDVRERYMYWSSHGTTVTISRAGMDGHSRGTLISSGLVNPTCLTLDKNSDHLYWVDGGSKLQYISLSTRKQNTIKLSHHSKTLSPFSLAVYGNRLYWADSNLKKIMYANKYSGDKTKIIGKYKSNPVRIAAFQRVEKLEEHPCMVNNGGCSHLCLLSPTQTLICACPAGRKLGNDSKTCQSEISRSILVNSDQRLHQVPLGLSYKTDVLLPSEGNANVVAFDIDIQHRIMYFANNKKQICYVSLHGGNHHCILSNMIYVPGSVAFDPVRQHIYWTDFVTKKIYLSNGNGMFWTVIIWNNITVPSTITVAYKHGYIFWVNLGKRSSISRANMDGSSRIDIVTSAIKLPNGLAVDHQAKLLYWTDYLKDRIEFCDFYGNNRKVFAQHLARPTSIALLGRFVYWSEWTSKTIKKADKRHGIPVIQVINGMNRVSEIKAVKLRNLTVMKTACDQSNGGCSHFCLSNLSEISCVCPVGLRLLNDGKNCETAPSTSILFSAGDTISRISLDTDDFTGFPLPLKGVNNAVALTFDINEDRIYWTDTHVKVIYSAFTNGTDTKVVIKTNLTTPVGIALDWIGRNLYWSDANRKTIEISNLDGLNRATLVSGSECEPRDIAVHPLKGFLFWTDWGKEPHIERLHMDGKSRHVLIKKNVYHPSGLAIDFEQDMLYWADSFLQTIVRCDFEGRTRFLVIKKTAYPFRLALFGSHIYWTDQKKHVVERAKKESGSERLVLQNKLDSPMGIIAVSKIKHRGLNACSENNGNCGGICLPNPNGRSCADICDGKLCFKEPSDHGGTTVKPVSENNTTSCVGEYGKECSTARTYFTEKKEKTIIFAYIIGGIVLMIFVITMTILIFLCQRRLKSIFTKRNKRTSTVFKMSFKSNRRENTCHEKEIYLTDPTVCILSGKARNSEESPVISNRRNFKETTAVKYQPKDEHEYSDENQCLTISDV